MNVWEHSTPFDLIHYILYDILEVYDCLSVIQTQVILYSEAYSGLRNSGCSLSGFLTGGTITGIDKAALVLEKCFWTTLSGISSLKVPLEKLVNYR